jgi:hypothetical protein
MVDPEGAKALLERGTVEAPLAFMRSHVEQQFHHRRGAEHDAGTDEDVPHPHRLGSRSSSPATTHRSTCRTVDPVSRASNARTGIDQLAFVHLTAADVVRHQIVADIVAAYGVTPNPELPGCRPAPAKRCRQLTMSEPDSTSGVVTIVVSDEQTDVAVDADRWADLATAVLQAEAARAS